MTVEVDIHVNDELCFNKYMVRSGKPSATDVLALFGDMMKFFDVKDSEARFISNALISAMDVSTEPCRAQEG